MNSPMTNTRHREQARVALKNNWGTMALIAFLALVFRYVISLVIGSVANFPKESNANNFVAFLLNIFLYFAITYATYYCALRILRGKKVAPNMLMTMFQGTYYLPMLLINLIQYIIGLLFSVIILLPVLITSGATMYFGLMFNTTSVETIQTNLNSGPLLGLMMFVFGILMIFISVFISGVFQFAVWIKIDDPQLGVGEILKYGLSLMKGRFAQYILLQLSFVGWYILGTLVFGIGLFWVIPYHDVSIASFYDTAREENGEPALVK